jgi:hypothetical protein
MACHSVKVRTASLAVRSAASLVASQLRSSAVRNFERRWNLLAACLCSTAGLVLAGMTMGTWWALVGMSIAAMGFYGSKGPFFAMPPMFLSSTALAAGIAWINSIGNLGGFFGPWYVGLMKGSMDWACWLWSPPSFAPSSCISQIAPCRSRRRW